MKNIALVLAVFAVSLPAPAELVYAFSFTPTTSPIQNLSFSITSPTFIGPGAPGLVPFTITDGSHTWTMDQALAGISTGLILGSTLLPAGDGCFSFASSGAEITNNGCATAIPNNGTSEAAFTVDFAGGLPSNTGTYSNLIFDGTAIIQPPFPLTEEGLFNCCGGSNGAFELTVTQTPEPSSFLLLALGVGLIGGFSFGKFRRASSPDHV